MNKRLIPAAAGLVILYAGVFQLGMASPLLLQAFSYGLDKQALIIASSLALSLGGQTAFGYCAASQRSVVPAAVVWALGSMASVVAVMKLGDVSGGMLFITVIQQLGGPIAVMLARPTHAGPPMRRELGAVLLLVAIGHVVGTGWMVVYQLHIFGSALTVGTVLGMSISPGVALVLSAFAVRAARSLLAGDPTAAFKVAVWKWVSIGTSTAMTILTVIEYLHMDQDFPRAFMLQPVVGCAISAIMPLSIGQLVARTQDEPVDPRDAARVPTFFAWAALWVVPLLIAAAFVARSSFVSPLLGSDGDSHAAIISALCVLAAALLFATSFSVVRGLSFAKLLTHVTAALSVCAAVYVAYTSLQLDARGPSSIATILPVGSFITFAAGMVLLAMFEARREQDLAPARVVD
ncbi:MAG TPA: hypothetical protein VGM90_22705 [Kofleriaceae bacterium]|jgi:hypothetical protein